MRHRIASFCRRHPLLMSTWNAYLAGRKRACYWKDYGISDLYFDWKHNIDTQGLEKPSRYTVAGDNAEQATWYLPVRPMIFKKALESLPIHYADYTFLDVGSGKGRAALLASKYGFRRVIGVEFAKELNDTAKLNAARWKSTCPVEFIWSDILDYDLPQEPTVIFMFHPFNELVVDRFLVRIADSISQWPRDLILIYVNPELQNRVTEKFPGASLVAEFERVHRFVAYRLPAYVGA